MENTESATVFGSGMGAITTTLLHFCGAGDHVVSSRTVYGGTYAFLKNFASQLNISTSFVDITDLESIKKSITKDTKLIYCEAVSNPLLEVADLSEISKIAKQKGIKLVVDNTFSPLSVLPANLGADIVIHSITKFINGTSDIIAGVVCGSEDFINQLRDVNDGASMLLGSTLDSLRAASVLEKGSNSEREMANAMYLAGFDVKDVHMTDLIEGRETLEDIKFIAAVGGMGAFNY